VGNNELGVGSERGMVSVEEVKRLGKTALSLWPFKAKANYHSLKGLLSL